MKLSSQSHILFYKVLFDKEHSKPPVNYSSVPSFNRNILTSLYLKSETSAHVQLRNCSFIRTIYTSFTTWCQLETYIEAHIFFLTPSFSKFWTEICPPTVEKGAWFCVIHVRYSVNLMTCYIKHNLRSSWYQGSTTLGP